MRKFRWTHAASAAVLAMTVLALPVQAQRPLIVVGGINNATVDGDDVSDEEVDSRTAFFFAVGTAFAVSPTVSISPFVGYTQRGFEEPDGDGEVKITYIDVPIFIGVGVPLNETLALNLSAGPRIGFNLGCDLEEDGASSDCSDSAAIGADPESIDFGLIGDVGIGLTLSPTMSLGVGVGYDYGLVDVFEDIEAKHRALFFYVGLSTVLGG